MTAAKPPPRRNAPAGARNPRPSNPTLLALSWGHEGWGSHTLESLEMVDTIEHAQRPSTSATEQGP